MGKSWNIPVTATELNISENVACWNWHFNLLSVFSSFCLSFFFFFFFSSFSSCFLPATTCAIQFTHTQKLVPTTVLSSSPPTGTHNCAIQFTNNWHLSTVLSSSPTTGSYQLCYPVHQQLAPINCAIQFTNNWYPQLLSSSPAIGTYQLCYPVHQLVPTTVLSSSPITGSYQLCYSVQ